MDQAEKEREDKAARLIQINYKKYSDRRDTLALSSSSFFLKTFLLQ